jgi:hypothetical protein
VLVVRGEPKFEKNIARIFRKHNIFDYKSPDHSPSEYDFYNAMSYALQYKAIKDNKAGIDEITLSFVSYRKPVKLLGLLKGRYAVARAQRGIYYVSGDGLMIPIQIIVGRELDPDENLYLNSLRRGLDAGAMLEVIGQGAKQKLPKEIYDNYMQAVIAANPELFLREVRFMEAALTRIPAKKREELEKLAEEVIVMFGLDKKYEKKYEKAVEKAQRE